MVKNQNNGNTFWPLLGLSSDSNEDISAFPKKKGDSALDQNSHGQTQKMVRSDKIKVCDRKQNIVLHNTKPRKNAKLHTSAVV